MGRAFHRKQIPVNRTHTRGTGIRYVDTVPLVARELTPEQVAAKEAEAQQQAALCKQRDSQQQAIDALVTITGKILQAWKKVADHHDQRLTDFTGWTRENYCGLPVEANVARFYADLIQWHQRQVDRPLSLEELDEVVQVGCKRRVPTDQILEEATKAVRYAAQECTTHEGTDLVRFVQMMLRRSSRAKSKNNDLDRALGFVANQVALMLQKLEAEEGSPSPSYP